MTHNVDALGDKVNPTAIAGRQMDTLLGAVGGVKDKVMGAAHNGGVSASSLGGAVSDRASPVGDTVAGTKGAAAQTKDDVADHAAQAKDEAAQ